MAVGGIDDFATPRLVGPGHGFRIHSAAASFGDDVVLRAEPADRCTPSYGRPRDLGTPDQPYRMLDGWVLGNAEGDCRVEVIDSGHVVDDITLTFREPATLQAHVSIFHFFGQGGEEQVGPGAYAIKPDTQVVLNASVLDAEGRFLELGSGYGFVDRGSIDPSLWHVDRRFLHQGTGYWDQDFFSLNGSRSGEAVLRVGALEARWTFTLDPFPRTSDSACMVCTGVVEEVR
jgi:hypothetical protein